LDSSQLTHSQQQPPLPAAYYNAHHRVTLLLSLRLSGLTWPLSHRSLPSELLSCGHLFDLVEAHLPPAMMAQGPPPFVWLSITTTSGICSTIACPQSGSCASQARKLEVTGSHRGRACILAGPAALQALHYLLWWYCDGGSVDSAFSDAHVVACVPI